MKYDPKKHHRRSIRMEGYDYSQAEAYFVTVCRAERRDLLTQIVRGQAQLSRCGEIVQRAWFDLPRHYPYIILDAFCIMPNHVHGIIIFDDTTGGGGSGLSANNDLVEIRHSGAEARVEGETRPYNYINHIVRHGLPEVVRAFKSFSARRINELAGTQGTPFWQRNYYERIIRDENELNAIRVYIQTNPLNWEKDQEYR